MLDSVNFLERANPIADKFYQLTRDIESSNPKTLKPNAHEQQEINKIISLPDFWDLQEDQKGLLWRYRYEMSKKKEALCKFLNSVNWSSSKEQN